MKSIFSFLWMAAIFVACQDPAWQIVPEAAMTANDSGRNLVRQYCSSCHLPVQPDRLNKQSWVDNVLPAMALRLGIKVWNKNQYYPPADHKSVISFTDWGRLVEFFKRNAPDSLKEQIPRGSLGSESMGFMLLKPLKDTRGMATTVMVAYESISKNILSCDDNGDLYKWNSKLNNQFIISLPSAAVGAVFIKDSLQRSRGFFTLIGTMSAVDQPVGELVQLSLTGKVPLPLTIANKLPRPVQSVAADFNKDGLRDWVVCGFGHDEGALYLFTQRPGGVYDKTIIRNVAGATKVITGDFNHDGWTDVICLFAHGDEGIWLFSNDQKGSFESKNLLRFEPEFGSTSFQMVDMNKDGLTDILYTCGDNSDYSRVLKPYHGIYLFLNDGKGGYKQSWFAPVNGCTKALAADFDGDGDMDIASIAFFADLKNHPEEKFLYFRQDQTMQFSVHALPLASAGRWICMDAADIDADGDLDIILGNYSKGFLNQPGFKPDWNKETKVVVLKNTRY